MDASLVGTVFYNGHFMVFLLKIKHKNGLLNEKDFLY